MSAASDLEELLDLTRQRTTDKEVVLTMMDNQLHTYDRNTPDFVARVFFDDDSPWTGLQALRRYRINQIITCELK